jgi:hypothetical protein
MRMRSFYRTPPGIRRSVVYALNCQQDIAQTILEQQADYVFALKGNHPQLHRDVVDWVAWAQARDSRDVPYSFHQTVNQV